MADFYDAFLDGVCGSLERLSVHCLDDSRNEIPSQCVGGIRCAHRIYKGRRRINII